MQRVNLLATQVGYDEGDPDGYNTGYVRIGPMLGS